MIIKTMDDVEAIRRLFNELRRATAKDLPTFNTDDEDKTAHLSQAMRYKENLRIIRRDIKALVTDHQDTFPFLDLKREFFYHAKHAEDGIRNGVWSVIGSVPATHYHRAIVHCRELTENMMFIANLMFLFYHDLCDPDIETIRFGLFMYGELLKFSEVQRKTANMEAVYKMQAVLASYDDNGNKIAYEEGSHSGSGANTSTWTVEDWKEAGASSASSAAHSTTGFSICIHCGIKG